MDMSAFWLPIARVEAQDSLDRFDAMLNGGAVPHQNHGTLNMKPGDRARAAWLGTREQLVARLAELNKGKPKSGRPRNGTRTNSI